MNGVNDAMILRRFAQKMANISARATMGDGELPLMDGEKGVYDRYVAPAASGASALANEAAIRARLATGATVDPNKAVSATMGTEHHPELAPGKTMGETAADYSKYLPTGEQLGGAALGGLGAMGLARLFQSERDKERGYTPMLAGLAGAGAGAIGLPMLLKYLASQGGAQTAAGPAAAPAAGPVPPVA